jgi:hypothetical protein
MEQGKLERGEVYNQHQQGMILLLSCWLGHVYGVASPRALNA